MSFLPQRDDTELGGAQERAMGESVGGFDTIRTAERQNGDGTWSRLHTRNGWPLFETDKRRTSGSATIAAVRGFVAKVPGGTAVLFDPYTLTVLKSPYTPALNTYGVQDFATAWNVSSGDATHWCDTVIFDGTTIKVNSKSMPSLAITADHGFSAIPYLIWIHSTGDEYGNVELNTTEKRVFAVGRFSVKSWGGGGVVETLMPEDPRTEGRCLTIGQRTDSATNTAWLGQMYHSGYSWNDNFGEWYFTGSAVTMLLTAPYLTKVSSSATVPMVPPSLVSAGTSSGSSDTAIILPPTPVAWLGTGGVISSVSYPPSSIVHRVITFPASGVLYESMPGTLTRNYNITTYTGIESSTQLASGTSLSYSATNTRAFDDGTEQKKHSVQNITLPGPPATNSLDVLSNSSDTLVWTWTPGSTRGINTLNVHAENLTTYDRDYENQDFSASVTTARGDVCVSVDFSIDKVSGYKSTPITNSSYYDGDVAAGAVSALYGTVILEGSGSSSTALYHYKEVAGSQTPTVIAEINNELDRMASLMCSVVMYDARSPIDRSTTSSINGWFYHDAISPDMSLTSLLTWATKDFILYDAENGVFISVEGNFSGIDALATLTVLLRVKTRHDDTTQTLGTYSYNYGSPDGMLPEREIGSTGKYAIQSPQIRAIFAPLYQEQGSFKGAHYVTMAEEGNGATAFHGFNFLLYLRPYANFDTCNEDNETGQSVYFVPCNLLEMLYAFVFSSDLGVAEDGTRYPVTHSANFTTLMSTLFSNPIRVSVRDGSAVNWTDSFGADFAAVSTVSLHRT